MARGQQKIQSQQKNAEKQAKQKKGQGSDQKKAAQAALVYSCAVCKVCIFNAYYNFWDLRSCIISIMFNFGDRYQKVCSG